MADYQRNFMDALTGGYSFGQQIKQQQDENKLKGLAALAQGASREQRQPLLQQMAGISPQFAQQQRRQWSGDDEADQQELISMARFIKSAPPEQQAAAYTQILPKLRERGMQAPEWGPQTQDMILQTVNALASAYGDGEPASNVQSTFIDAQGNRVAIMRDGSTQVLGQNAPNNQIIDTGNGFYGVNKGNLSAAPVMVGGQPQQASQPSLQAGLYQTPGGMVRIGDDLTPEMQQAALADIQAGGTAQNVQLPPRNVGPQQFGGGQQLRSAPKPRAPSDLDRRLAMADQLGATPEEKRRMVIGGESGRDAQRISAKDATTARQKITQIRAARQQINSARQAFQKLRGTFSAGLGGQYLPTPEGQAFDRAIANLAPLITAVTRVPGVGAMSDYESRLQNAALPSRGTYEDVTVQQFQDLENLLNTVEGGYNDLLSGGQAPAGASDEEDSIDDILSLYR